MEPKGCQMEPKWSRNGAQRVPNGAQMEPKWSPEEVAEMRSKKRRSTPGKGRANGSQMGPFLEPCANFWDVFSMFFSAGADSSDAAGRPAVPLVTVARFKECFADEFFRRKLQTLRAESAKLERQKFLLLADDGAAARSCVGAHDNLYDHLKSNSQSSCVKASRFEKMDYFHCQLH